MRGPVFDRPGTLTPLDGASLSVDAVVAGRFAVRRSGNRRDRVSFVTAHCDRPARSDDACDALWKRAATFIHPQRCRNIPEVASESASRFFNPSWFRTHPRRIEALASELCGVKSFGQVPHALESLFGGAFLRSVVAISCATCKHKEGCDD